MRNEGADGTVTVRQSSFTTRAQASFRQGGGRRMLGAAGIAILALVLFALFGPDEQTIKEQFEYYGAPGEMKIMPEISIDDGADRVHQLPKSLREPPPPASIEVEPEDLSPDATDPTPPPQLQDPQRVYEVSENPVPDAEEASVEQVELLLPQQSSLDFFLLKHVLPEYPLSATEADKQLPYIFVWLQVFAGPDGNVTDIIVESNDGSPVFAEVAVEAVSQWLLGWRVDPGAGRWLRFPIRFKSPYFTPSLR